MDYRFFLIFLSLNFLYKKLKNLRSFNLIIFLQFLNTLDIYVCVYTWEYVVVCMCKNA